MKMRRKDAFDCGYQAYLDDKTMLDNPFHRETEPKLYSSWQDGYLAAVSKPDTSTQREQM